MRNNLVLLMFSFVLFWWFVVVSKGLGPDRISQVGPFETKKQCEEIKTQVDKHTTRSTKTTDCWECQNQTDKP